MAETVLLQVPQKILDSARPTLPERKGKVALSLHAQGRLSTGKARELAGLSRWEFRHRPAARRIPAHYDRAGLDQDVTALRGLGRL